MCVYTCTNKCIYHCSISTTKATLLEVLLKGKMLFLYNYYNLKIIITKLHQNIIGKNAFILNLCIDHKFRTPQAKL